MAQPRWQDAPVVQPSSGGGGRTITQIGQAQPTPPQARDALGTQQVQAGIASQATGDALAIRREQREAARSGLPQGTERGSNGEARGIPFAPVNDRQRWNATGTALEDIPGWTAPPSQGSGSNRPLSDGAITAIQGLTSTLSRFDQSVDSFDPNYSGFGSGLENWAQGYFDVGTPGQRDWWSNFEENDAALRHAISGASLTPAEQANFERLTVSPGMRPEVIQENIARRRAFAFDVLRRQAQARVANGENQQAIRALLGNYADPALAEGDPNANQIGGTWQRPEQVSDNTAEIAKVADPVWRGHAMRLQAMINNRRFGDKQILEYARENLPNSGDLATLRSTLADRRANPGRHFQLASSWWERAEERGPVAQAVGSFLDTTLGTGALNYANAATYGALPSLADAVGIANADDVRAGIQGTSARNPVSAVVGDIAGSAVGYGNAGRAISRIPGASAAMANRPIASAVAGDVGYGATRGAFENPEDPLSGAALGATVQATGGAVGRGATQAVGSTIRGVANAPVQRLVGAEVPLTLGQAVGQSGIGQAYRGLENAAASLPGIGSMITNRHVEARAGYNRSAYREALLPINSNIGDLVGEEAAAAARSEVAAAYGRALNGRQFTLDYQMRGALGRANGRIASMVDNVGRDYDTIINQQIGPMLRQGDVQGALRAVKEGRSALAGTNGSQAAIRGLADVERNLVNMIRRQHPDAYPLLRAADQANRRVSVLERATGAAINNPMSPGIFTPAQVGAAARDNTRVYGGRAASVSPRRPFYESQRDAQTVLPSTIPNSGTTDRALLSAAILGGGAAGGDYATGGNGSVSGSTAGILGLLALANTRGGTNVLRSLFTARNQGARNLGEAIINGQIPQISRVPAVLQPNASIADALGIGSATLAQENLGPESAYRP